MKNLFKIHPFFYLFAILCIFTGYFKNFLFITFIVLFHELGHILMSIVYKWNIDKIILLPFGALTIFNEKINRPIIEELMIAIMGPLFQILLFKINNPLFKMYNLNLLLFNLIPIFPLDGSKILNLILNKMFSFKYSHIISIIISFIFIILLFLFKFNLVLYVVIFFLLYKTYLEYKNHKFIFNKFLCERYMYKFNFKKTKIVENKNAMKRDYKHLFRAKNKYVTEREILLKLFDKQI